MNIKEPICFYLGKAFHTVALKKDEHQTFKAWVVVAAAVSGWAVGFFFAAHTLLPASAAIALFGICTYAGARLISDILNLFSFAASQLLAAGGERGRQLLQGAISVAPPAQPGLANQRV